MEIANQSDDSDVVKPTRTTKKKKTPVAGLTAIAEDSDDNDNETIFLSDLKKGRVRKRPILEETDSDGFGPLSFKNLKSKAGPGGPGAAENVPDNSAAAEGGDIPPSKKLKLAEVSDVDAEVAKPGGTGKKKDTVRGAIEAIQKDNSAGKRFGDGPEWNRRGKEGRAEDTNILKRPNQDQGEEAAYVIFFSSDFHHHANS